MDYTTLSDSVVFVGLLAAIAAVGALKVVPIAASWGVRKLLGMIGR